MKIKLPNAFGVYMSCSTGVNIAEPREEYVMYSVAEPPDSAKRAAEIAQADFSIYGNTRCEESRDRFTLPPGYAPAGAQSQAERDIAEAIERGRDAWHDATGEVTRNDGKQCVDVITRITHSVID